MTNSCQKLLFDLADFEPLTQASRNGDTAVMLVAQAVEAFLANMPVGAVQADKEKRQKLALFKADFGHKQLSACKPIDLKNWIDAHPEWVSGHTRTRIRNTVQSCFNWCIDPLGIIKHNPFAGRIRFKKGPEGLPMDEKLFRLYMRESDALFRRPMLFIYYTGARPCEMANAEWDDLDLGRAAIVLHTHKTSETQKVSRPRTVILHPVVIRLLIWLRRHGRESGFIFVNKRGLCWKNSAISQRLTAIRKKHGIPKARTLYGLRHRFACQAILNGVDLATLAELMGHRDIRTTTRYVHIAGATDHLQAAVRKIHG